MSLKSYMRVKKLNWEEKRCPVCASSTPLHLKKYDRYLLKVSISYCEECSHIYCFNNICPKSLDSFYTNYYRMFYEGKQKIDLNLVEVGFEREKAKKRVDFLNYISWERGECLEIGFGQGLFLHELQKIGVDKLNGFEPNNSSFEYASNQLMLGKKAILVNDFPDINKQISEPNVSLVVMFHVLEHLHQPLSLLQWIRKSYKNAHLMLELPLFENLANHIGSDHFHFGHHSYFSRYSLENLLYQCGYKIEYVQESESDEFYPGQIRVFCKPVNTKHNYHFKNQKISYNYAKQKVNSLDKFYSFKSIRRVLGVIAK